MASVSPSGGTINSDCQEGKLGKIERFLKSQRCNSTSPNRWTENDRVVSFVPFLLFVSLRLMLPGQALNCGDKVHVRCQNNSNNQPETWPIKVLRKPSQFTRRDFIRMLCITILIPMSIFLFSTLAVDSGVNLKTRRSYSYLVWSCLFYSRLSTINITTTVLIFASIMIQPSFAIWL